jgi:hypothetical protein
MLKNVNVILFTMALASFISAGCSKSVKSDDVVPGDNISDTSTVDATVIKTIDSTEVKTLDATPVAPIDAIMSIEAEMSMLPLDATPIKPVVGILKPKAVPSVL